MNPKVSEIISLTKKRDELNKIKESVKKADLSFMRRSNCVPICVNEIVRLMLQKHQKQLLQEIDEELNKTDYEIELMLK